MSPLQILALLFVAAYPVFGWWARRRPAFQRASERTLAVALLLTYAGDVTAKALDGRLNPTYALPMQLCDWAFFAIAAALWWRWRAAFDLAYFWGLAGTLQALFTPAIAADLYWLRRAGFFFIHAGIVAGVLHLVVNAGFRPQWPRSLLRILLASELYLAAALLANALTGANYGFLSHKPVTPSLLDLFSDTPWLYIVQLNLIAFAFFAVLYLPWLLLDRRQGRTSTNHQSPPPPANPSIH